SLHAWRAWPEERPGQREREEARREAGELARLVEVGEGLFAVHLDDEAPARRHDPAYSPESGRPPVVDHLAEHVASRCRALGHGPQRLEGASHGGPSGRVALEGGNEGWRAPG